MPKIQKQILYFIFAVCLIIILWYLSEGLKANPSIETVIKSKVTPTSYFIIERDDYILSYDARNRNPLWVLEHLTAEKLEGSIKRDQFKFKEDERIPQIFRATIKDYRGSGFDRGHMAPAANHKSCEKGMADTFYLSNVCPQIPSFNRGYWAKFEKHVRNLTNAFKDVYIISGGLYIPYEDIDGKRYVKYEVFGENNIAVPTHYFKVLILENESSITQTEAYILPHEDIPFDTSLEKFKVPLERVEKISGILFH